LNSVSDCEAHEAAGLRMLTFSRKPETFAWFLSTNQPKVAAAAQS
jgi:hypothetical protein